MPPQPVSRTGPWRRLTAVSAEGVASGTPYMVGTKLLQGWLAASGVPLGLIGLLAYAELPYTLKMVWAPLLDRWPIPWPDGLLNVMAVPFLIQQGFSPAVVGSVLAGWGIGATIVGTILGGLLFSRLGMNRSLWLFALVGAAGNLGYWALAQFDGGSTGLLLAVGLENLGGGLVGAAFVALLMSLCNPRFSATQYALLSGVYALSRSVLSGQAGFMAQGIGWSNFFLLTAAASLPAFLLMAWLTPWHGDGVKGAFDPSRDST